MTQWPNPILFGAAYYYEYQPAAADGLGTEAALERLATDLDLMAEAGFSVIRVGESVWSTWEPENGRFDLDWLQPVLDGAHEHGIAVILGTPTYAVPPWLVRLYPEIAAEHQTGRRVNWGGRQEADYTHPAFRFHAERVIRKIMARYGDHPAVIGFQVDNEPGVQLYHNEGVFQRFVDHLRHQYGDVETLNREWGLVYWSHRLSMWADLWRPDGNAQPQYEQAWRRFQTRQTTEFIAWQRDIAREYAREDQFVTTCISYGRPGIDERAVAESLDVTSGNPYYRMQDSLALPVNPASDTPHWTLNGTWSLYQAADAMYGARQEPFLITETNASSIGEPSHNKPAYDGQWRQAAWALVSRGARMIEYWHWHTLHFGAETYWGGVLPHSQRPGRTYRELATIGAEFRKAGAVIDGLVPHVDVAVLSSKESEWALAAQPALANADGSPDRGSLHSITGPFYKGAFDAGLQSRIVHTEQLGDPAEAVAAFPVLVAAGIYAADDALLDWMGAYAAAGGHLVIGPRTGYGDEEARARLEVKPARLDAAAGVWYDEFANLDGEIGVRAAEGSPLVLGPDAGAAKWADGLVLAGAESLAEYVHPHYGRFPAATTAASGAGRITYVGTIPNAAFGKALFEWIAPESAWRPVHPSLTVTSGVTGEGRTVRFVHNWSWDEADFTLPAAVADALDDTEHEAGASLRLGPWDVKVLVERDERVSQETRSSEPVHRIGAKSFLDRAALRGDPEVVAQLRQLRQCDRQGLDRLRAIAAAVVHQHHVARRGRHQDVHDRVGPGPRPVLGVDVPQLPLQARLGDRRVDRGVGRAVGRTEAVDLGSEALQEVLGAGDLLIDLRAGQLGEVGVAPGVVAQRVARFQDRLGPCGIVLGVLAELEEGGLGVVVRQHLQDLVGVRASRPVVEGEEDGVAPVVGGSHGLSDLLCGRRGGQSEDADGRRGSGAGKNTSDFHSAILS